MTTIVHTDETSTSDCCDASVNLVYESASGELDSSAAFCYAECGACGGRS